MSQNVMVVKAPSKKFQAVLEFTMELMTKMTEVSQALARFSVSKFWQHWKLSSIKCHHSHKKLKGFIFSSITIPGVFVMLFQIFKVVAIG